MLKAIESKYLVEDVDVRVLRDYEALKINDKVINLRRGSEVKVPRWLARKLAKEGYVTIITKEEISYDEISRYVFLEGQGGPAPASLIKLPKNFYIMYRDYIKSLTSALKEKYEPKLLEELEKSKRAVQELVNVRLRKILIAVQMGIPIEELRDRLAYEEEVLYSSVSRIIREWNKECVLTSLGGES